MAKNLKKDKTVCFSTDVVKETAVETVKLKEIQLILKVASFFYTPLLNIFVHEYLQ